MLAVSAALLIGTERHGAKLLLTIAAVTALVGLSAFATSFWVRARVRRLQRRWLVHWEYDAGTADAYRSAYARKYDRRAWMMLGGGVILGIATSLIESFGSDPVETLGPVALIGGGTAMGLFAFGAVHATTRAVLRGMRQGPLEAFLGDALYVPGQFHDLRGAEKAELGSGEPAWLTITYEEPVWLPSGRMGDRTRTCRVLVPPGLEHEAQAYAADLG